jgi:beta-lactamase class A
MRISTVAGLLVLFGTGCSARSPEASAGASSSTPAVAVNQAQPQKNASTDKELAERLQKIAERAGGEIGVAVIHVETNGSVEIQGARSLPIYSVFKLPLAITVLKAVEENRLRLDQQVLIAREDVVPGWQGNTDLWREPGERSLEQLLEFSISRSDNTSSDKLLQLVGGPQRVTEHMRSLGLQNIDVHATVREIAARRANPNTGSPSDLARLLARLQKGEVLAPAQLKVLLGMMERATTGARRLRGDLPSGTPVADKTGTGENTTNDVGLITLPQGKGHLAMAVFINGSKLSSEAQEKLIAELARAAYDAYVSRSAQEPSP